MKNFIKVLLFSILLLSIKVNAFEIDELAEQWNIQQDDKIAEVGINKIDAPTIGEIYSGSFDIISFLGFPKNCYITQDESSHNTKRGGRMFALDIACKKYITRLAPNYLYGDYTYKVSRKGFDKYLGDYITIDFVLSDNKIGTLVYGHTTSPLNIGDEIKAGEFIGEYSPTGITSGPHLHIELWVAGKNITFDMQEENEFSEKLRFQRGWMTEEEMTSFDTTLANEQDSIDVGQIKDIAFKLIQKWEGKHNNAYWDIKGYSICYGSRSHKGEYASDEECKSRTEKGLDNGVDAVIKDFAGLNNNQYGALVSYWWNCNTVYNMLVSQGISEDLWLSCRMAGGKVMKGLERRRQDERRIFKTK